jgi:FtsZ-binding cell division protein ZapB
MDRDITQSELNEMATNMKDVADGYDDAMAAIRARGLAAEVVSPQEAIDYLADKVATLQREVQECERKRDELSKDLEDVRKQLICLVDRIMPYALSGKDCPTYADARAAQIEEGE